MFERFELLINENTINKLKNTTVMVIGIGGVGGYSVETLVRSNIGNIIIVDYDSIDISNINRQIIALNSTIGLKKVNVLESRIKDINPDCNVIIIDKFIDNNNVSELFCEKIDYIIDACDTVSTKKLIIKECINRKIKFISSMGMGNKLDPTKLEIVDIRKTECDGIARIIRKMIKDEKIKGKIMVVSSKEPPIKTNNNVMGSTSYVPSIAGMLLTSYIINDIIKNNR